MKFYTFLIALLALFAVLALADGATTAGICLALAAAVVACLAGVDRPSEPSDDE